MKRKKENNKIYILYINNIKQKKKIRRKKKNARRSNFTKKNKIKKTDQLIASLSNTLLLHKKI